MLIKPDLRKNPVKTNIPVKKRNTDVRSHSCKQKERGLSRRIFFGPFFLWKIGQQKSYGRGTPNIISIYL